ncbi:hypothetical protein [Streptomyces sp. NPDC001410]|uniref:hypothetical protein n=1 Tax=Streptomyces sp. NPDC001410 TaxID=3364574 RepID=UPI003691C175
MFHADRRQRERLFAQSTVAGFWGGEPVVGRGAHIGQGQRRVGAAVAVAPLPGVRAEAVLGQQPVAVRGDQVGGVDEVVADGSLMK